VNKYNVDLMRIMVKPLYWGLLINIFVPVLILGIAYYLDQSGRPLSEMSLKDLNIFFWSLVIVSIADGVVGFYFRQKQFLSPMIRSKETFEDDLAKGVFTNSIICYSFCMAIAIYGLVFYFLGGQFIELFFFIFLSFISFQLIRPRLGFLEKVLAAQEKHVEEGRFLAK
jgi:hypothetical protein